MSSGNSSTTDQSKSIDTAPEVTPDDPPKKGDDVAGVRVSPNKQAATVGSVVASLVDQMPAVQQHVVDADTPTLHTPTEADSPTDRKGRPFDPAIHCVNSDGSPFLTPRGKIKLKAVGGKKPGRPKATAQPSVVGGSGRQKSEAEIGEAKARQAGIAAANTLIALGIGIGGDEWSPRTDVEIGLNEHAALEQAFGDYFTAKGLEDVPPGVALTIAVACYMLPRFQQPKTKSRLQRLKRWLVKKYADRKLKKHGLKAVPTEDKKPTDDQKTPLKQV